MKQKMDVFSSRDLRNRAGNLLKDAEEGRLSILTKHGRPMAIALPFDSYVVEQGVHIQLAAQLFDQGITTLAQSAKIASLSIEEFLEVLQISDIEAVRHIPGELADDLKAIS